MHSILISFVESAPYLIYCAHTAPLSQSCVRAKTLIRQVCHSKPFTLVWFFLPTFAVAFDLYDIDDVKAVSREETLFILRSINRFIVFFGDEQLDDAKLHAAVDEVSTFQCVPI